MDFKNLYLIFSMPYKSRLTVWGANNVQEENGSILKDMRSRSGLESR
jgi:hypothetical protein